MVNTLLNASALHTSSTRRKSMIASQLTFPTWLTTLKLAVSSILPYLVVCGVLEVYNLAVRVSHFADLRTVEWKVVQKLGLIATVLMTSNPSPSFVSYVTR